MADCCCTPPPLDSGAHEGNAAKHRRILWAVLAINAVMSVIEVGAGLAAGSASLQADALDFMGDAANYGISLFVVSMALRYRASAALAKSATMGTFGLLIQGIEMVSPVVTPIDCSWPLLNE
jgi:Co/Zn/Cd efflux system component